MTNNHKYYHNDYKKLLGVDESRTASEKLLDRAIGGFKRQPIQQKQQKAPQKKVKEQNKNLTHQEILSKILKNLQGNINASKLIKPLALLKKCLNDPGFSNNTQINTIDQWTSLVTKLFQVEQKVVGNYSQIHLMNQQMLQIFMTLEKLIKKIEKGQESQVKVQQTVKIEENQVVAKGTEISQYGLYEKRCSLQILYCKMHTDDSFIFNKTLLDFKKMFFEYFQTKTEQTQTATQNQQFFNFMQNMLMKLFKLPYTKHEWVKTSLSQFFKQFNITYKMLLEQELCEKYLKSYNLFLNYKLSRGAGEQVNVFANSSKGGKITQIQTVSDGLEKWTSRQ